jgi:hypothetical protein
MNPVGANFGAVEDRGRSNGDAPFSSGRFAWLLFFLIVAAFPDVVLQAKTFIFRDFGLFSFPIAWHHRDSFWHGELPLWNPLNNCGVPFLAQWNTLVLYPLSLVYLLFPLPWSLTFFCLLHLFLAGMGMYFFVRDWTGHRFAACAAGVMFAFNGLTLNCLMWPGTIAALGWMPWVLRASFGAWRHGGRKVIVAAFLGALQMLTGAPEIILFTWLIAGALCLAELGRGKFIFLGRLTLLVVLVGLLAAAQLLPFLDLLAHSQRGTASGTSEWSMPLSGLANFLVPLYRSSLMHKTVFVQDTQYWTSSYYPGIAAVWLALGTWRFRTTQTKVLLLLLLLSLALALGQGTLIYDLVRPIFPLVGFINFPIKFLFIAILIIPIFAAQTMADWQEATGDQRALFQRRLSITAVVIFVLIAWLMACAWAAPPKEASWTVTLQSGATRALLLVLLGAIFLAVDRAVSRPVQLTLRILFLLLLWFDVITHTPRQNPTASGASFEPYLVHMEPEPRFGQSRALIRPASFKAMLVGTTGDAEKDLFYYRHGLFENCNLADGLAKVDGFFPVYLRDEAQLGKLYLSRPENDLKPLVDFLGVSQMSSNDALFKWVRRDSYLPLITAGQKPVFAAPDETLKKILQPDFEPRREVYLPVEARRSMTSTQSTRAKILSAQFSAHKIAAQIEADQPAVVVIAQSFYHRWTVRIDGRPAPLWKANYAFQACEIPGGRHRVELRYRDAAFLAGAIVSSATLIGCLGAWMGLRRKSGRETSAEKVGLG